MTSRDTYGDTKTHKDEFCTCPALNGWIARWIVDMLLHFGCCLVVFEAAKSVKP